MSLGSLTMTPIGVAHTPYVDRVSAPRQPYASLGVRGTVELLPGFEFALCDLESWDRLWVLFWFHLNETGAWRSKVLAPRSAGKRRGVFATRSPHRPNPIGLSVVRLEAVRGLTLHVLDVDFLDGTPVLDVKPYVPWADAFPEASRGWVEPLDRGPGDPEPGFEVAWSPFAWQQVAWLRAEHGLDLDERVIKVLALGPQPHPYRRIRREGDGFRLAVKDWRIRFRVEGRQVTVERVEPGYGRSELALSQAAEVVLQRAFVERFAGACP
ncbi:MAG: tRNA (N6-threonylcarbamoyladenosine(37)-N6)-methyltransferase TrmO [Myxococcales bacterium]